MGADLTDQGDRLTRLFARTGGRVEPGLDRTRTLLSAIADPQSSAPVFHVAGTNGKGSTCATIDALLRWGGQRVGRYTSPHLVRFNERILVDGAPIADRDVNRWLDRLEPMAEKIGATFFEITTALAFGYFAERRVDVMVIETGLGGRLDSTNVVDPVAAAVTSIALDHTQILGATLEEIAAEKAGIFKEERPAVIGEQRADLAHLLAETAAARGAAPIVTTRDSWRAWSIAIRGNATTFTAQTPYGELRLSTPLLGEHQAHNTMTALAAVDAARMMPRPADLNRALARVSLPGRLQRTGEWIFDVAHNPSGARVLAQAVAQLGVVRPVTAVVAVLRDKDWAGVLDELTPVVSRFIITQPDSAPDGRAWDPVQAAARANALHVPTEVHPDLGIALTRAASLPGTKLVTGSFHTVGDAMRRLGIVPSESAPAR